MCTINHGCRPRRLGVLGPGQHFGECSCLLGAPLAASVVARDFCELYRLGRQVGCGLRVNCMCCVACVPPCRVAL